MTAEAATNPSAFTIERADPGAPILVVTGRDSVAIRAGTVIRLGVETCAFEEDTPVQASEPLVPGSDYGVDIDAGGKPFARRVTIGNPLDWRFFAGFHHAPSGNAVANEGGDGIPAINPFSCWDVGFRPVCPDPRGMALVELPGGKLFWADIYLLGIDHAASGTSVHGATIADGLSLPAGPRGSGRAEKLDYATASEIYAGHGKQLLGAEEFFAAAYGVRERCSRDDEPTVTGSLDGGAARFVSRRGLFDVTGTMWQWGTDGHPDDPRASFFGGSWISGGHAGSRYAYLGYWPGVSNGDLSARGRSDHLTPVPPAR